MTMNPYQQPTDPAKRKSAVMTDGSDRAPARAMLKAIGFDDAALARPIVGVATTWIETMPCNINQRDLAKHVKVGIQKERVMPPRRLDLAEGHRHAPTLQLANDSA